MILKDGYRKIKYAMVEEIELNNLMSENEIDEYITRIADGKEVIWCDADEEIFSA